MDTALLSSSSRVAFVALTHDLGKFAQRAKIEISQDIFDSHLNLYCPYNREGNYHSHHHAAFTGYAIDLIEKHVPELIKNDTYPFVSRKDKDGNIVDSMINAAAGHHKPETFLQWIIATADRVSSGFEREQFEQYNVAKENSENKSGKNHYQTRLLTLLEQINLSTDKHQQIVKYCYPLKPLSADTIFPKLRQEYEPSDNVSAQKEYRDLWDKFLAGLEKIPRNHRRSWDLWLDHFDSLWQNYTTCIPSATAFGVKPDVSLYDHSKATAALATALWRWHEEMKDVGEEAVASLKDRNKSWHIDKFLLIQGDFFGIQDFIFSSGAETQKQAAKLLRGRSFQVSLFSELAALKVLQACNLPSTSQIINAAGKFMIVAPNTESTRKAIQKVQSELNQWFIDHTYGLVGLGLAVLPACCNDFVSKRFGSLIKKLFQQLEEVKLQRLDLINQPSPVLSANYPYGTCKFNSHFPAQDENKESLISIDQIKIGNNLVKKSRVLVTNAENVDIYQNNKTESLSLPIFGYQIVFTENEDITGKFGSLADDGILYRCWDFSIPTTLMDDVWQGYAHRYINTYVPKFDDVNSYESLRYRDAEQEINPGFIKTFDYIACEDREPKGNGLEQEFIGQIALATLKGDVDNLGKIFQKGLEVPTFARMAALSRQMNLFFSLWLPVFCKNHYPNSYTVFAGGDDFFLIGPWYSMQQLALYMNQAFTRYVAQNPNIHFSAGLVISKLGLPVTKLGDIAEKALEKSKGYRDEKSGQTKNAVTIYNQTVSWNSLENLYELEDEIERLAKDFNLSTSYLYSLIQFSEQADSDKLEDSMWRSRFYYKTSRYVADKLSKASQQNALHQITISLGDKGINQWKSKFKIPLFNHFYKQR